MTASTLYILFIVSVSWLWPALCMALCSTPERAARNGRVLGVLGVVLGLSMGVAGATFGFVCSM